MIPKEALAHFKKKDPILHDYAIQYADFIVVTPSQSLFSNLCDSIIGQQLSTKVGDVISGRFMALFPEKKATPELTITFSVEQLRALGLSNAKAKYILDLAQKVHNKEVHLESFAQMQDQDVIDELIKVKGIGPWTAEMFLMFTLGREDIFSAGDLGLKRGIQKIYGLSEEPTLNELLEISSKWSPFRTYASRVLWRTLDNTPL